MAIGVCAGLELRILALEGGVFGFQLLELGDEGGSLGSFGFEGGNFATCFTKLVKLFFGFLVAGLGVTTFFGEAFVLLFQFVQASGLFAVDLRHVSFRIEDG